MYEAIKTASAERIQTEEIMLRQIGEEFKRIDEAMESERKVREDEEEGMLEMLREVIARVRDQIG